MTDPVTLSVHSVPQPAASEPIGSAALPQPPEAGIVHDLVQSAPAAITTITQATAQTDSPASLASEDIQKRNAEEKLTENVRSLESALQKDDPAALSEALETVKPLREGLSPAGETLIRQAEITLSASEAPAPSAAPQPGAAPAASAHSDETAETAQTPADTVTVPADEKQIERLQTLKQNAVNGTLSPDINPTEALSAIREEIAVAAAAEPVASQEGEPVGLQSLHNNVLASLAQQIGAQVSVIHTALTVQNAIDAANAAATAPEKFEHLREVTDLLHDSAVMEASKQLMARQLSDPKDRLEAMINLSNGPNVTGSARRSLLAAYDTAVVGAVRTAFDELTAALASDHPDAAPLRFGRFALAAKADPAQVTSMLTLGNLDFAALTQLARAAVAANADPLDLLCALEPALFMPGRTPEQSTALVVTLLHHLETADHSTPKGRMETLQFINMVFQDGLPEFADQALAVKKYLLPEHNGDAVLEHSLMLAHREAASRLMDARGRHVSAVNRQLERTGQPSLSARSFVLTPETAALLIRQAKKTEVDDVNLRIANLAVLEMQAARAGLYDFANPGTPAATADGQKLPTAADLVSDPLRWYDSLGLDEKYVKYARELDHELIQGDAPAANLCMGRLVSAAADFGKGFEGVQQLADTEDLIRHKSDHFNPRRADRIFMQSPGYLVRRALNHIVADLTGKLSADQRLADPQQGLTINAGAIAEAMRLRVAEMVGRIADHDKALDLNNQFRQYQRGAALASLRYGKHADVLTKIAKKSNEITQLQAKIDHVQSRAEKQQKVKNSIRFSWPHTRGERRDVARLVLEFNRLKSDTVKHPEHRADNEARLTEIRESLTGVDPAKMVRSSAYKGRVMTDELIQAEMLPRAQSLAYFDCKITGAEFSQADKDSLYLLRAADKMDVIRETARDLRAEIKKSMGKDNARELMAFARAAVLQVYSEMMEAHEAFSLRDPQTAERVLEQLRDWGLNPENPLYRPLIRRSLDRLTMPDGTINLERLKDYVESEKLEFAGKAESKQLRRQFVFKEGKLFGNGARIRDMIQPEAAVRQEGVSQFLNNVNQAGRSVVFNRERGLGIDTGALYAPWDTNGKPFAANLLLPLTARLKVMRNDSLAVTNTGRGYEVIVKGGLAASIGATIKKTPTGSNFTFGVGADGSYGHAKGVALTFASREEVERFVKEVLTPGSDLTNSKKTTYDRSVWLNAADIRVVTDDSVSGNLSLTASYKALALPLDPIQIGSIGNTFALGAALNTGLNAGIKYDTSRTSNAKGETFTARLTGTVMLTAGAAVSVTDVVTEGQSVVGKISKAQPALTAALSVVATNEHRLVTNEKGVDPSTSLTTSLVLNASFRSKPLLRKIFSGADIEKLRNTNPAFETEVERLLGNLPAGANVVVKRTLTREAHQQIQSELVLAKTGTQAERNAHIEKARKLLASGDSYKPVKLSVVYRKPTALSKHTPGIACLQIARNHSLTVTSQGGSIDINLEAPRTATAEH